MKLELGEIDLTGPKSRYTIYLPSKLREQLDNYLKEKNKELLVNGKLTLMSRSSLLEEILVEWLYTHQNLEGLDDLATLGYTDSDKEPITVYISDQLLGIAQYISVEFDKSPNLIFVNAIDWYLSVHWGGF